MFVEKIWASRGKSFTWLASQQKPSPRAVEFHNVKQTSELNWKQFSKRFNQDGGWKPISFLDLMASKVCICFYGFYDFNYVNLSYSLQDWTDSSRSSLTAQQKGVAKIVINLTFILFNMTGPNKTRETISWIQFRHVTTLIFIRKPHVVTMGNEKVIYI